MRRALLGGALALVAAAPAAAHHGATAPTKVRVIQRIYPDLHARELARTPTVWNRLRAMARSRWERQHPAARRRHRALERRSPRHALWMRVASCECVTWRCDTGNGYQGGLQMDRTFQRTYGPEFLARWGGAHRWPVWAQMRAADRAYVGRGLSPWPVCGLARLGHRPVP